MALDDMNMPGLPEGGTHPIPSERRSAERVQTVFRVARAIAASDEGLARIRNISDHGARVRMLLPLTLSDMLTLELADGVQLGGQVVWKTDDEFGLQFASPIRCEELLAGLAADARSGTGRPVRLPVVTTALIRSERGIRSARVVDMSQRGLKLVHNGILTEGRDLAITLPTGHERRAIVRWTRDHLAGLMLLEPLGFEALGSAKNLFRPLAPVLWSPDGAPLRQAG